MSAENRSGSRLSGKWTREPEPPRAVISARPPSELPPMEAGDKFENLPPVPDELRKKFSLSIADLDESAKKKK